MNEIADGLYAGPPPADSPEIRPGEIGEKVGLAISAGPEERQRFCGRLGAATASASVSTSSARPLLRKTP
jgi:hypothetical protein